MLPSGRREEFLLHTQEPEPWSRLEPPPGPRGQTGSGAGLPDALRERGACGEPAGLPDMLLRGSERARMVAVTVHSQLRHLSLGDQHFNYPLPLKKKKKKKEDTLI